MFGSVGGPEFLLIAVLALLLFGPRKLPQIGRSIGRAMAEFRGATQEFKNSLQREVELEELRGVKNDLDSVSREITETVRETTSVSGDAVSGQDCPPDGETPEKP